jgi:HPt (histidine-containing phosphotransfer) domain-containing protein
MDKVLLKPIAPNTLLESIASFLDIETTQFPIPQSGHNPISNKTNTRKPFTLLINSLQDTRQQIEDAHEQKDWNRLSQILHKFIGGLAYCDLPQIKQAAESVYLDMDPDAKDFSARIQLLLDEMGRIEQEHH